MRVLMLGWDFSPRISGGVGTACRGLAESLARAPAPLGAEVLFLLPRLRGDEEAEGVDVRAAEPGSRAASERGARATQAEQHAETIGQPPARAVGASPASSTPVAETPEPAGAPTLPSPAEALRLLTLDSPLRPYLSPADYKTVVQRLFARLEPEPGLAEAAARTPARLRASARRASPVLALAPPPEPPPAAGRVPPYGRTLRAEVERYARAALALAQHERFDVIHAHDWMTFPAGMLLREHGGKPLVVHFHSCEPERRGLDAAPEARVIEQTALDVAERVLCVSEASARTLRAHYALEYAKLRVLHNALTPLDAAERPARDGGPVVLFLGRLSEQKSPDVFLRAAARVHARLSEARFVLAGEGELYPELRRLARELGLERRVRFTGFVGREELARVYGGADVYVLSSAAEPFGISALEALSLGVPTIVPRGAGVSEVVRSVLTFAPPDEADLAEKIVALLTRPALRSQLSAAGLREVKRLRWDRPARALRGIYDEVVRGST